MQIDFVDGVHLMRKMTATITISAAFAATTVLLLGQNSSTAGVTSAPQGPTLAQTISFMNNAVTPEDGYITSINTCELYFTRNRLFKIAIPSGTYLKFKDQFGIAHYGHRWTVFQEPPQVPGIYRFRLEKIDPSSINSKPAPSVDFAKNHDGDLDALKHPDLDLVTFETANGEQAIDVGHFEEGADGPSSPVFASKAGMGMLVFQSKDRAERFVTTFVHAVEMCGGKGDLFAPTPSHP